MKTENAFKFSFILTFLFISFVAISQNNKYKIAKWYKNKDAAVSITFDDGTANQFYIARPMLDKFGFKGTFYIISDNITSKFFNINWDTLKKISLLGHEIGSHTQSHLFLNNSNKSTCLYEIKASKDTIDKYIKNQKCHSIAYPGGVYNDTVINIASTNYISGRIGLGYEESNPSNFLLLKSNVPGIDSTNWNSQIDYSIKNNKWNIERIHGIDGEGSSAIPSSLLNSHLSYLKQKDSLVWVSTLSNVTKYIRERENSSLNLIDSTNNTQRFNFTTTLDTSVYNHPLTLSVIYNINIDSAEVLINNIKTNSSIIDKGCAKLVTFEAIPNYSTITINVFCKSCSMTVLPKLVKTISAEESSNNQSICLNSTAKLKTSMIGNYLWSNGSIYSQTFVSPKILTTYTLTVTSEFGCQTIEHAIIKVNQLPTVDAGTNKTICKGNNLLLNASGIGKFKWSNNETTSSIIVNPIINSTYNVTVTDTNNCSASDFVTVIVNPLPNTNAVYDQSICIGGTARLKVYDATTFLWSNGATSYNIAVSPKVNSIYTVTATHANGCSTTKSATITINKISAEAGNNQTICLGQSTSLFANGGENYLWNNGETSQEITIAPNTTSTYYVTTSGICGTASDFVVIKVNPSPIPDPNNNQIMCYGGTARLKVTGGNSYLWSNGATTYTIATSPKITTTYTVTASNAYGCTITSSATVTVYAGKADAGINSTICKGKSTTLNASGGTNFMWSNGSTNQSINVSPNTNSTYTVTVSSICGSATDNVVVIVNPIPTEDSNNNQSICYGGTARLKVLNGTSYNWSTGATTYTIAVSPKTNSTYTVTVNNAYNCQITCSAVVTVIQLPIVDAGNTQTICYAGRARLRVWEGTNYNWSNGGKDYWITVSPKVTSTYTCTASNDYGCSITTSAVVTVIKIQADAGSPKTICRGQSVNITATGGKKYVWNTGEITPSINVSPAIYTSYKVTITDAYNCSASDYALIYVNPLPYADSENNQTIHKGETARLKVYGAEDYLWSNGNTTYSIAVSPMTTTSYKVTATTSKGCSATFTNLVTVLPDLGSPYINSINDYNIINSQIKIYPLPVKDYIIVENNINNYQIKLFDIKGKLLLSQNALTNKTLIDINIASGIYILEIISNNQVFRKHIIVE